MRASQRPRARFVHRSIVAGAAAIGLLGAAAPAAQAPRREPPVRIPGTDVVLGDGWTLVFADARRCMYAVPAAWTVSAGGGWTLEPHGRASVEVTALDDARWAAHRQAVASAMASPTLLEDTPLRFRLEQIDGGRAWQHVAERDGVRVCAADIEARPAELPQDIVVKIAASVHVAPERALEWTKKP